MVILNILKQSAISVNKEPVKSYTRYSVFAIYNNEESIKLGDMYRYQRERVLEHLELKSILTPCSPDLGSDLKKIAETIDSLYSRVEDCHDVIKKLYEQAKELVDKYKELGETWNDSTEKSRSAKWTELGNNVKELAEEGKNICNKIIEAIRIPVTKQSWATLNNQISCTIILIEASEPPTKTKTIEYTKQNQEAKDNFIKQVEKVIAEKQLSFPGQPDRALKSTISVPAGHPERVEVPNTPVFNK